MTAPITPMTPPAAAPAGPVGLPPGFGLGGAPKIGNVSNGVSGGIPADHFGKPILFRIVSVTERPSKYEGGQVLAPTVDYIVLDPGTGEFTEVRNVTIMQKNIRNEIVGAHHRGLEGLTGVATEVPGSNDNPAKVLRALDDTNSSYGAEAATEHLVNAARTQFGWWPAA
jgi:hypothetical protein